MYVFVSSQIKIENDQVVQAIENRNTTMVAPAEGQWFPVQLADFLRSQWGMGKVN